MLERCVAYILVLFVLGLIRALHVYLWTHMREGFLKRLLLGDLWHWLRRQRPRCKHVRWIA